MWKLTSSVPHNGPSLFSSAYGPVSILFLCCAELVVASLPCQLLKYPPLPPACANTTLSKHGSPSDRRFPAFVFFTGVFVSEI